MIEWLVTLRVDRANVATPLGLRATVAIVIPPFLKVTVPVGVPEVADFTVAVNVTDWLNDDGFTDEVRLVVLPALFTVCVSVEEVLPL